MTLEELELHIEGCKNGNRHSQQRIYRQFFALGMSICIRYSNERAEAEEMCHDGFLRAFSNIKTLAEPVAVKSWLRKIFTRAAIDHFRKYRRSQPETDLLELAENHQNQTDSLANLSYEEKLQLVQALPPAYRLAFNLCVVEEYPTGEVAEMLGIAEGTVRSNLAKARFKLREMIEISENFYLKTTTT